jgi:hypothetical protein
MSSPNNQHAAALRLAAALQEAWDAASDALEAVRDGRASFTTLVEALEGVAELTAEALADGLAVPDLVLHSDCGKGVE